jgi:HD-GYP domain-containing protein (c-di-GMP phosphodiesterase class II)
MREHSLIGERILRVVPSFKHVAAIVRASHERWDGTGYPDRLAGDEIPLPARIIAVADAFCAMVEDRPYAAARTPESAVEELRRCMGTQFDPRVVSASIAALSQQEARPAASSPSASGWTDGARVAIEHVASRQHAT